MNQLYRDHEALKSEVADLKQRLAEMEQERDKLLKSEQHYHEDTQRMRAALEEIVNLPDPGEFLVAWGIAFAVLRGDDHSQKIAAEAHDAVGEQG